MSAVTQKREVEPIRPHGDLEFRGLLERLPAAAYTCDAAGLITYYNERAVQLWGRKPLLNDPVDRFCGSFRLFTPDGRPIRHDDCWMARTLREDRAYDGQEIVIERPDGSRRTATAHANPFHGNDGRLAGAVNVLVDITERKLFEDFLTERTRLTGLRADIGVALTAPQPTPAVLQQCCAALVRRLDVAFARIWVLAEGSGVLELQASAGLYTHCDGRHSRIRVGELKIGRIARDRQPHLTNDVLHDPNISDPQWAQKERMVAFAGYPLLVEGRCLGVIAMFGRRPLSEAVLAELAPLAEAIAQYLDRKRVEEEVRRANQTLRALVQSCPLAVVVIDPGPPIVRLWNPAAERLFGWSEAEVVGRPIPIVPEEKVVECRRYRTAVRSGQTFFGEETYRRRQDGSRVDVEISAAPLCDVAGQVTGLLLLFGDITARKRVEEALREADRRKDEFLATLAHELRNPLAPLRNGLQVMRLAKEDRLAIERAWAMMDRQLGQMVRLIDDLLDLSRITQGKIELRREVVELAHVVQQAVETSQPVIEEAGHNLAVHLPAESVFVDADVVRLAQVLANLLNNAAKYTEPGGEISLTIERQDEEAVLRVRDTGVGIPPTMLPRVFDMFAQVDRSLDRSQGGLGIGLSLVRGLVEMHGGCVTAHSDGPGHGSEFVIRLPTVPAPPTAPPTESAAGPSSATGRRILIVDDNGDSADSLAMMLRLLGHETETAHDGLTAIEAAERYRPDVVLLDIGLPGVDGYEACRRIRSQPWGQAITLIAQTGWGSDDDRLRTAQAGFDAHLVKPIDYAALMELLHNGTFGPARRCREGAAR